MKITKQFEQELESFLNETGFELCNAGFSHRMQVNYADDGFRVCEFSNPLNAIKVYKTAQNAVNFMIKQDEL